MTNKLIKYQLNQWYLAEEQVTCEPLSRLISLLMGNLQGILHFGLDREKIG
jgi:hypothetical protein